MLKSVRYFPECKYPLHEVCNKMATAERGYRSFPSLFIGRLVTCSAHTTCSRQVLFRVANLPVVFLQQFFSNYFTHVLHVEDRFLSFTMRGQVSISDNGARWCAIFTVTMYYQAIVPTLMLIVSGYHGCTHRSTYAYTAPRYFPCVSSSFCDMQQQLF